MSKPMPPTPLRQEDYQAIEAAVMETARGRWFLAEYARRNRNADTDTLLSAIDKLENTIVQDRVPDSLMQKVRIDLADMASAIEKTKKEIAQIKHEDNDGSERFERTSSELGAIVSQTEAATGDILGAAEKIQEYAWTLREQGADEANCDALDIEATNIYMACSFQDLTGQRIKKIVDAMRYVESRVNAMIGIWGFESKDVDVERQHANPDDARPDAHLLNGPALQGEGIVQTDVDSLLDTGVDVDANQDDVDALFGSADIEADVAEASSEAISDSEFDGVAEDLDSADAVDVAETAEVISADVDAQAADELAMGDLDVSEMDASDAEVTADAGADEIEFVDVDELDWADDSQNEAVAANAEPEVTEVATAETLEADIDNDVSMTSDEADVFASAESVGADPVSAEAESDGAQADVFVSEAREEIEASGDADVFAQAPDSPDTRGLDAVAAAMQQLQDDDDVFDLRDRVSSFS